MKLFQVQLLITNVIAGNDHMTFRFGPGQPARIGRDPNDCDVIFHDQRVSRRHAVIRPAVSGFVVEDLGSKTGTLLNGSPLTMVTPIHSGDVLEVGPYVLVVMIEGLRLAPEAEETHNLSTTQCPNCRAQVLQGFDSCLVCGAVL